MITDAPCMDTYTNKIDNWVVTPLRYDIKNVVYTYSCSQDKASQSRVRQLAR